MATVSHWSRLIRLPNLLIVAVTICWIYFFLPSENSWDNWPGEGLELICLIMATLLVTAAGNIINDICDQEIDQLNKPGRRLVGTLIPLKNFLKHLITLWIFMFFLVQKHLYFSCSKS